MDSLGDRMKENYENKYRFCLTRRTPVIMRLDGKSFHTLTRNCEKPFDIRFYNAMLATANQLCNEIQGTVCVYTQSDEISLFIKDYDKLTTDAPFGYNIQKLTSIAAAIASVQFTSLWDTKAYFDCRVFNIPESEVCNYFIWRQNDCTRNSVLALAQANFSHKELQNKSISDLHEMLHTKKINWADLTPKWKNNGTFICRNIDGNWISSYHKFTKFRYLIEDLVPASEE